MHSRPNTRCLFWIAVAASFLPPQLVCTHTHAQAHTHTHTCAHTHARTITHARTHMRTHTRTHTHACARTHTHIHTRTHKHTHTQTHTHTRLCWLANMASSGSKAALRLLQPWSAHVCVCVSSWACGWGQCRCGLCPSPPCGRDACSLVGLPLIMAAMPQPLLLLRSLSPRTRSCCSPLLAQSGSHLHPRSTKATT